MFLIQLYICIFSFHWKDTIDMCNCNGCLGKTVALALLCCFEDRKLLGVTKATALPGE